jgi:hypothetical protein
MPDFARGPDQPVDVPATGAGLPISISEAGGVTSVSLTLHYDPALLNISNVAMASGLTGWSITAANFATSGQVALSASGPALSSGTRDLFVLTAAVPVNATYAATQVLRLENVQINGGAVAAVADRAVQKVAFFGDATGNRGYSAMDASLVARLAAGLDSGLNAFPLLDPAIIADVSGNGGISSLDASYIARTAVHLPQPEIPPLPASNVLIPPYVGIDPILRAASVLADAGSPVQVPIMIEDAAGVQAVDISLSYDTALLDVASLTLGSIGAGWILITNVFESEGIVRATLFSANPLPAVTGDLLALNMTSPASAFVGDSSPIGLITPATRLNEGRLALTAIDGDVTISTATVIVGGEGGSGDGNWTVRLNSSGDAVEFVQGEASFTRDTALFTAIQIAGGDADDLLTIDLGNGNPLPAGGLRFTGGAGSNSVRVTGMPAGLPVTLSGDGALVGTAAITWDGLSQFSIDGTDGDDELVIAGTLGFDYVFGGGGGNDRIIFTGGVNLLSAANSAGTQKLSIEASGSATVNVTSPQTLDGLVVSGSASVALAPGGGAALRTTAITIAQQGALDLAGNDLIIQSDGDLAPLLADISQWLFTGRNGGLWDGVGIHSSGTQIDALTGPRALLNDNGQGQVILSELAGHVLDTRSIFIRQAVNGDTNLDGAISGADYFKLDREFLDATLGLGGGASLFNTDLDYSGRIDGDDFFIIDRSYLGQSAVLAPAPEASVAPAENDEIIPIASEPAATGGTPLFSAARIASPAAASLFAEPLESIVTQVLAN